MLIAVRGAFCAAHERACTGEEVGISLRDVSSAFVASSHTSRAHHGHGDDLSPTSLLRHLAVKRPLGPVQQSGQQIDCHATHSRFIIVSSFRTAPSCAAVACMAWVSAFFVALPDWVCAGVVLAMNARFIVLFVLVQVCFL